jgi:hypothetical protein
LRLSETGGTVTDVDLIVGLQRHAGFRMLPLLNTVGNRVGLHFHRFVDRELEVVQAWGDNYVALTRLPNEPDFQDPFREASPLSHEVGTFAEVVNKILYPDSTPAAQSRYHARE